MTRHLFFTAVFALAAVFAAGEASAAMKPIYRQGAPIILRVPRIIVIPPSLALNRALALRPGGKALGVRRKGNDYFVKLRDGNEIVQVQVDGTTGEVIE